MKESKRILNSRKILMILQSEYPPYIRLTKEIKTLVTNGYIVYLLCNNKSGLPLKDVIDGAVVIRLNYFRYLPLKLMSILNVPLFFIRYGL